ncbi:MAG TPA: thioredoxin-like domain-containing protein [Blastocatellia bacterium]|nr:thioredoxin-like domain-containing protein [Blastocatellia bacterium]
MLIQDSLFAAWPGRPAWLFLFSLLLLCPGAARAQDPNSSNQGAAPSGVHHKLLEGTVSAPEFPNGLEWLNTDRPLSLRELRGKIVLLDFWTYCCINCMHIIPDLKKLEAKYGHQLLVIGVHSAKFPNEKGTENIRQAILRYEIEHPVVNDREFEVWGSYSVEAWPTLVLINPEGKIVKWHAGEDVFNVFDEVIGQLTGYFRAKNQLNERPLSFKLEKYSAPPSLLSYPGKVLADERGDRLFISDSNHNRIVITSLDGTVREVIGDGTIGARDGGFAEAEFNHPQGLALDGETLYICDTENHLIRKADLKARTVVTIVGTGKQARRLNVAGVGREVALNSPWDALVLKGQLYVAMAGSHQLWIVDLKTGAAGPYAGSSREERIDGKLREAALAQPSGITTDGKSLFFADSEVSSIRSASLETGGAVSTLVGEGLFEYGDVDGIGEEVRLQHPLGLTFLKGKLYVADTYNHKIKQIDLTPKPAAPTILPGGIQRQGRVMAPQFESRTFAGRGDRGMQDGDRQQAHFNEPGGVSATSKALFVADTNNHLIRRIDLAGGRVSTLELKGLQNLTRQLVRRFRGRPVEFPKQAIAPGAGTIALSFVLPAGYKYNQGAPFYVASQTGDEQAVKITARETARNFSEPKFPIEIPIQAFKGETTATIDAVIYFCNDNQNQVCLVDSVRAQVPLEVKDGAPTRAKIEIEAKTRGK